MPNDSIFKTWLRSGNNGIAGFSFAVVLYFALFIFLKDKYVRMEPFIYFIVWAGPGIIFLSSEQLLLKLGKKRSDEDLIALSKLFSGFGWGLALSSVWFIILFVVLMMAILIGPWAAIFLYIIYFYERYYLPTIAA